MVIADKWPVVCRVHWGQVLIGAGAVGRASTDCTFPCPSEILRYWRTVECEMNMGMWILLGESLSGISLTSSQREISSIEIGSLPFSHFIKNRLNTGHSCLCEAAQ